MARRGNKQSTNQTEGTQPEAPTGTQEGTVSTTTAEAPASTETPAPAEGNTEAAKAPEAPIDLTQFQSVANAAVAEADTATGSIPEGELSKVVAEYRGLDGVKAKNKAKTWLNDQMKEAMNGDDIAKARAFLQLHESMTAGSSGKSGGEKVPADPTEAFVQQYGTLRLALGLLTPGEGVDEAWADKAKELVESSTAQAQEYLAWVRNDAEDKGDEPEVSAVVKNAVKLATGKAAKAGGRSGGGSTFTGERRDIAKHIESAFEGKEVGTFMLIAEIRNHQSEEYGTDSPSAGAISARLFPASGKVNLPKGIEPATNDKGNKGARKVA
jgi:hypothetical protein